MKLHHDTRQQNHQHATTTRERPRKNSRALRIHHYDLRPPRILSQTVRKSRRSSRKALKAVLRPSLCVNVTQCESHFALSPAKGRDGRRMPNRHPENRTQNQISICWMRSSGKTAELPFDLRSPLIRTRKRASTETKYWTSFAVRNSAI